MNIGEKIIIIEELIYRFANTQFQLNNIDPTNAHIIMECVNARFEKTCLNNLLMERVSIQETGSPPDIEKTTGTPEELFEAFKNTGFTHEREEGEKCDST